jgi:phosphotransferase system enzyme I (PtsI)
VIVVAHDLTPSQTASFPKDRVLGFAVDVGGPTSHSAILARARQLPAVLGLEKASSVILTGDTLIIDGNRGLVVVNPDRKTLVRYRRAAEELAVFEAAIASEKDLPAVSADGLGFNVFANMEFPEEVESILAHGADGVGLFRTEFLYLRSGLMPTEEEHYQAYVSTARRLGDKPLVIRTFDLGADKIAWEGDVPTKEQNPFLGCRSIRLSQHRPDIFRVQLRAILRAAGECANIAVMVPMITVPAELAWTRQQIARVSEELAAEGVQVPTRLRLGMMVEVPAAALSARGFASQADFFSIGTNDLIQYTLAVDRTNQTVAGLYNPAHPAVLALIRATIEAGREAGIPVAMCGEMAGDPLFAVLLAGMGLREFSVTPPLVPELKKIIRSIRVDRARRVAQELESCTVPENVMKRLRQELEAALPGAGDSTADLDPGT